MTPTDLEPLEKLATLLDELSRVDPAMSVGELRAFVSVAAGHADSSALGITPSDIRARGFSPSAVTRSIQYWGERFQVEIDDKDRRQRRITLTEAGKTFAKAMSRALR